MLSFRQPSSKLWLIIYIGLPLIPVLFGGFIRLVISSWNLTYSTFNAAELSIGLALLCMYINQDLKKIEIGMSLPNEDKIDDVKSTECLFSICCGLFIAFYVINVLVEAIIEYHKVNTLEEPLHYFQFFVFVLALIVVSWSISVQKSFKLEANL